MRKTKILITLGPSIENCLDKAVNLIDGVRFNMSHANINYCMKFLKFLNKHNIAKLMDLKGIKIRIKRTKKKFLKENEIVEIGEDLEFNYDVNMKSGDRIIINDGKVVLEVIEDNKAVVIVGGEVRENMGANFPDSDIEAEIISDEDRENIRFACDEEFEYIALSFVRDKEDVKLLRDYINDFKGDCDIIAKIETKKALKNLENIAKNSDGLMVARGDLGVEIDIEYIPIEQKRIIETANRFGIISITATQILDSMVNNPYPTRAEVTDIANAIYDGTDCLMLSNETAIGKYPLKAIEVLNKVAEVADKHEEFIRKTDLDVFNVEEGLAYAVSSLYKKLPIKLTITPTYSGRTAKIISKLRKRIIAPTPNINTLRKLKLVYGVESCLMEEFNNIDNIISACREIAKKEIGSGLYLLVFGHPIGERKSNTIKVESI
ncbi:pyruvate kinase [Methanocaldococcus villosus KIN24-T80]|uniref:Pyruvate kinase n=1 Tax=Methanocaldococcus villosus KIN24-T80 TaxID=1069083 RepID=N6UTR1_9EURY|nr:pyruvate kinase [Methanocaldococcus villosus]ENN95729.1 pyruvate kinase [Methanocaldococcus villosus KIN24-T80]